MVQQCKNLQPLEDCTVNPKARPTHTSNQRGTYPVFGPAVFFDRHIIELY